MEIKSVFDSAFRPYGQVVEGYDLAQLLTVLKHTPLPQGTAYVPSEPTLEALPIMQALQNRQYGGMPVQLGWCNGHSTRLNCLEYHRDSEVNLGTEEFILLLAKQEEMEKGILDTDRVQAFRVPAGVLVEIYATTLHYAPCHTDPARGFQVLVALPRGTNGEKPALTPGNGEDECLWARNKWLLAHPESSEAAQGAHVGLTGENIDIGPYIGREED